jgi:hypothetical protein
MKRAYILVLITLLAIMTTLTACRRQSSATAAPPPTAAARVQTTPAITRTPAPIADRPPTTAPALRPNRIYTLTLPAQWRVVPLPDPQIDALAAQQPTLPGPAYDADELFDFVAVRDIQPGEAPTATAILAVSVITWTLPSDDQTPTTPSLEALLQDTVQNYTTVSSLHEITGTINYTLRADHTPIATTVALVADPTGATVANYHALLLAHAAAIMLTFSAEAPLFPIYKPDFDAIIDSIRLTQ